MRAVRDCSVASMVSVELLDVDRLGRVLQQERERPGDVGRGRARPADRR